MRLKVEIIKKNRCISCDRKKESELNLFEEQNLTTLMIAMDNKEI
jgi:hypothetical protein